jgi:poly-gamma-glutamate synthesis protein (capsule biosynthesis protein)
MKLLLKVPIVALVILGFFVASYKNDNSLFSSKLEQESVGDFLDNNKQSFQEESVTNNELVFVGDIMLSRVVNSRIRAQDNPYFPFTNVKEILTQADLAIGNLESPFGENGPHNLLGLVFNADPRDAQRLYDSGFDVLSLANNHILDGGVKGLWFTQQVLNGSDLVGIGVGPGCHQGEVITKKGIRFGFLSYSYTGYNSGGYFPHELVCDFEDRKKVLADIAELQKKSDVLVVLIHKGVENSKSPTEEQEQRYRELVDHGVSLVIGSHPHTLQRVEMYHQGLIAYSLGNFVFDQVEDDQKKSALLKVVITGKKIVDYSLLPVVIENLCCPRFVASSTVVATPSKK